MVASKVLPANNIASHFILFIYYQFDRSHALAERGIYRERTRHIVYADCRINNNNFSSVSRPETKNKNHIRHQLSPTELNKLCVYVLRPYGPLQSGRETEREKINNNTK